jgi:acyl-CoA dehydrogenase
MGHADDRLAGLPFFEPRHTDLAERIEAWCRASGELWAKPHEQDPEDSGVGVLRALAKDGWLGFLDPDADPQTRSGGDHRCLCLLREALAYADDLADFAFSIQALSATPIRRFGTPAQQRRYLPGLADGSLIGAFAVSEENAGSDLAAIELRAERTDDGYRLNGHKSWIANGSVADVICVLARTGEGPGAFGLTAFLIPAAQLGGLGRERISLMAPRAFAHLRFDDCLIPADCVLGQAGGGYVVAMDVLERFRMTVGAAALGFARRAAEAALERARNRPIYDGRLFDLATIKATLADIEVKLSAAGLLVARAAWEADRGSRHFPKHSSIAKLYATEVAQEIVDAALQVFGAAGLVQGSITERLYRQVRSLRIYEGTSEIQQRIIAAAL